MYTKQPICLLLGLCVCLWLALGQSYAAPIPGESVGEPGSGWLVDSDLDGVDDTADLCPDTPTGVAVNAYGCPLARETCDYTTATVTLTSAGGSSGSAVATRYVLASNTGTILQVNETASFTGLSGTATYMAVALTYEGAISNLSVGSSLSAVSAACYDWSEALVFKACVAPPPVEPPTCDYQIGEQIVLQAAGGSTGVGIKTSYVLINNAGTLVRVSETPSFTSTGLANGTYSAYALTYSDNATVTNLVVNGVTTLAQVTADCLAMSPALSVTLCGCSPRCLPLVVTRIR
ncbi:hypothetical protein [Fibrivirga algicola]|uniref:Uncharacterized protein n=1 Tax=Fibrivirga algicola TaxID=2950420 RepID=A0ABX0QKM9_9BACT|nr:hypothetical protein [Fibrivirga algicola]NID12995.1 hypothetical protein [Fibrivirga algicola]